MSWDRLKTALFLLPLCARADLLVELSHVPSSSNWTKLCLSVVQLYSPSTPPVPYCASKLNYLLSQEVSSDYVLEADMVTYVTSVTFKRLNTTFDGLGAYPSALNASLSRDSFYRLPDGKVKLVSDMGKLMGHVYGVMISLFVAMSISLGLMLYVTDSCGFFLLR